MIEACPDGRRREIKHPKICSAIISDPAQLLACSGAEMLVMRTRMRAKPLSYQEMATDLKSLEG